MNKIIHYCWFGGKKKPAKLKYYIKTWKKYLPDYEIMEWNESNFDVNMFDFTKEAYKNKKWAFVSDVARVYALKEYGGIYFDTDVEIIKDVNFILDNEIWLGREDENYLATAMFGVKEPHNKHIEAIFNFYKDLKFDSKNVYKYTNPKIFTKHFEKYGLKKGNDNMVLDGDIHIYAKDYFNPKSYDGQNNTFTNNTCIVHHFDATWTPIDEKVAVWFIRRNMGFMAKPSFRFFEFLRKIKHGLGKIVHAFKK